ncbi:hypothetical protein [Lentzea sp. NBRC 102530]|uniref:hypothetical protein n=1 Tax=Lentzea sp. NBRC 102530 TaxID=3032201 RepID=UPI0024A5C19D|nr:hypothetical protein [Lentzea sp. NBRC 102530]GLY50431.1 hypothetical protein Lesp01_40870 [Lentzea sp. NBRC 102530]
MRRRADRSRRPGGARSLRTVYRGGGVLCAGTACRAGDATRSGVPRADARPDPIDTAPEVMA